MKRLILICGANGIGKSTACRALVDRLGKTAYIDSDYCRYMNPFSFSDEEIEVVISNISNMMINYFRLPSIENVLFQYGFHGPRKAIFESILMQLDKNQIDYQFCPILLECDIDQNISRMKNDGRDDQRIERAIKKTRTIYNEVNYPRIDTTNMTVNQTADKVMEVLFSKYKHA